MNILEAFSRKLTVSEQVYAKEHGGRTIPQNKKIAIARVLANTSEYITEAFENSAATQLSNMKSFKKFCIDLTTVALPSLISNELVINYPLKSRTGYLQYVRFVAGSNKGGIKQGTLFNDVFSLGKMDDARINYTGATVVETVTEAGKVKWMQRGKVGIVGADGTWKEGFVRKADGTETEIANVAVDDEVTYIYNNIEIPQEDIPQYTLTIDGIELSAKARRIGIYYSQMAAFQAKTEMGIDLGEVLATQACGELAYEIDTEVVKLLVDGAGDVKAELTWSKTPGVGVSLRDHYAAFATKLAEASQFIYDATGRYGANYVLCASNVVPILAVIDGFKASSSPKNGPYYAGELNGMKVFVSPAIKPGEFVCGYNGGDLATSAGVFAPYMAIVPTQLLGYADGGMSQGFSTLYDLKLLNKALLIKGKVVA